MPWDLYTQHVETWYKKGQFFIGVEDAGNTVYFFLYDDGVNLFNVTVFSVRRGSRLSAYSPSADYREIKSFLKAIADPSLFPLCVSFNWAAPILEQFYKGDNHD